VTDRSAPATKADLDELRDELRTELRTELTELRTELRTDFRTEIRDAIAASEERVKREITLSLAGEIARTSNVLFERMRDEFRAVDDRTTAVKQQLDEHISDERVHRKPVARRR
jgi:hypothetical protein